MNDRKFARMERANDAYVSVTEARDLLRAMLPPDTAADQDRWKRAITELDEALRYMGIPEVSYEDLDLMREVP